jgi:AraC-like DNA-binding protein
MINIHITSLVNLELESVWHHHWKVGFVMPDYPAEHFNLWLMEKGVVEIISRQQRLEVRPGDVLLVPIHYPRRISVLKEAVVLSIGFRSPNFNQEDIFADLPLPRKWRPAAKDRALMKLWMNQIVTQAKTQNPHRHLITNGLGMAVIGLCMPYLNHVYDKQLIHSKMPSWLGEVLRKIRSDPSVSVSELQRMAGFSASQFRKNFQQWTNSSPQQYLKSQRLEAAYYLLQYTDLSLDAITQKVGLNSTSYLSKAFKAKYGGPPACVRTSRRRSRK